MRHGPGSGSVPACPRWRNARRIGHDAGTRTSWWAFVSAAVRRLVRLIFVGSTLRAALGGTTMCFLHTPFGIGPRARGCLNQTEQESPRYSPSLVFGTLCSGRLLVAKKKEENSNRESISSRQKAHPLSALAAAPRGTASSIVPLFFFFFFLALGHDT